MLKKKVCMLGAFAVGKTSLVQQYVHSIFSDKYKTTVGVIIEKASVKIDEENLELIIWDLYGEDSFQNVRLSYLNGSSGCIFVADGTRGNTLETALNLKELVVEKLGEIPCVLVVNKHDLIDDWEIDTAQLKKIEQSGVTVLQTSAKTGDRVTKAFELLSQQMIGYDYAGS